MKFVKDKIISFMMTKRNNGITEFSIMIKHFYDGI